MTEEKSYLQIARAIALADGYSPLLRHELLGRPDAVDSAGIEVDATITLGEDHLSFRRSQLFPAIAEAFDRVSNPVIASLDSSEWTIVFDGEAQPSNVALVRGDQRLIVPQFSLLAAEASARLHAFQQFAERHRLSDDLTYRWSLLLSDRKPTDQEITEFVTDLQNTPVGVVEAIRESLRGGRLTLDTLVPRHEVYYRQLVGDACNATSLGDCVTRVTTPFLAGLLTEGDQQSLSRAWLLCSHQSVSQIIEREWKGDDSLLVDSLASLAERGDPISRTGAIELGLRRVRECSTLTRPLIELIKAALDGESGNDTDEFALLSALFNCIYGQMARCRILVSWAPFARRLAALAHASIVLRQVGEIVKEPASFTKWLLDANDGYFVMQTLVDMRAEPRWFPELGSAGQLKNELLGRIWIVANSMPETVEELGLKERLVGEGPEAIVAEIDRVAILLPGPLEGGESSQMKLSSESAAEIEETLTREVDTTTFTGLCNASLFYSVPDHLTDLAAEALERNHYQIVLDERVSIFDCVVGLASVAAVTRSSRLRDAIHIVLRVSWRLNPGQLSVDDSFRAGILACAARGELSEWAESVGRFLNELSLQDLSVEDADGLLSHLSTICHIEPELWGTCGRAHAALGMIVSR
ncbi:hypothetical protein PQR12_36910 [Paraburkholderia nemoris]|uniref:hypothetical protein n=1 Tax=Paraburkholderia nemoris TaxID=2793076 RepID=UPI001B01739E|nr:hypothetical protein [Paraburkholderia nemoris]CAE6799889.1 hypothetical protein LMG22931_05359 [Paraburkholderia nemoris]